MTKTIRLATGVVSMMTRDPLTLAKQSAMVDALSAGRFELGVGAGWLHA